MPDAFPSCCCCAASCCRLQAKLNRVRALGSSAQQVSRNRLGGPIPTNPIFEESLPNIIARQCAALDYRDCAGCPEPGPRTHPGCMRFRIADSTEALRQRADLAPLDALWGADVAAAETQMCSFATACYLAPRDRLRALESRSTIQRCADSVAALTRHERTLAARLALAQAFSGSANYLEEGP